MKRLGRIILLLLVVTFFCACQPTPGKPIVIEKSDLEQTIISEENSGKVESNIGEVVTYSEEWKETYTLPNLICEINADVIMPDANEFPVFKVKQRNFDIETVKKLVDYFTKGATGVRDTSDTKEELEQQLLLAKRGTYMWDDNGGRWEPYEGQEEDIAELEERVRGAEPEEFNPISEDTVSIPMEKTYAMPNEKRIYVDTSSQRISISSNRYAVIQPESWIVNGEAYPGEPVGTTIDNIKISEEDAKKIVYELLAGLGIDNLGIAETEKARIIKNFTYDIVSEGWQITLSRNDGNSIPVYIDSSKVGGLLYYKSEDYIYRWPYERFEIYVDENGIQCFYWEYPKEVVGTMNGNVPIKPLDEIKETIRGCLKYAEAAFSQAYMEQYGEVVAQQIRLSKVVLTIVLVPIKDEPEYHMFVPAWIVFYEQEDRLGIHTFVLAINAIDGSSIDLALHAPKE